MFAHPLVLVAEHVTLFVPPEQSRDFFGVLTEKPILLRCFHKADTQPVVEITLQDAEMERGGKGGLTLMSFFPSNVLLSMSHARPLKNT